MNTAHASASGSTTIPWPCDPRALSIAAATAAFHLATTSGYGIFRDELYYLACAERLAWGYVDHPPMIAAMAWLVRNLLGTSLLALRLLPALAAGIVVVAAAVMARHMGGGRYAQVLSAVAVALAPQYLGVFSVFTMNAVDIVVWSGLVLLAMRILDTEDHRLWVPFGLLAGLGLQNKLSVLFLAFGIAVGLLLSGRRRFARQPRLWIGAALALLIFTPHLVWQAANGWPTIEFVRSAAATKNIAFTPAGYFVAQVRMMNPVAAPLWLGGLVALFAAPGLRKFRALGWAYVAVFVLFTVTAAKPYYLSPLYPVLFAAGAVSLERVGSPGRGWWIRHAAVAMLVLSGAVIAPLAKPLLSVDGYKAYAAVLGEEPHSDERHALGELPQFFADMQEWRSLAEAVAQVHAALPAGDRGAACVFAQNYGQAGAVELFAPRLGPGRVLSGHNSYWLWGPGDCSGDVTIIVGGDRADHEAAFAYLSAGGVFDCRDCMPFEDNQTLWIARGLRAPMTQLWPRTKHFD